MVTSQKWLEEALTVQAEILSSCEELSISLVRKKSPDSALIMAEYMYRHIVENSNSNANSDGKEFANMLKELEAFNREDKVKAIGFFYESIEANSCGGCDIGKLRDIANWWKLGDKFELLVKAFFTETPPVEEKEEEKEIILVPEMVSKRKNKQ